MISVILITCAIVAHNYLKHMNHRDCILLTFRKTKNETKQRQSQKAKKFLGLLHMLPYWLHIITYYLISYTLSYTILSITQDKQYAKQKMF